MTHQIVVMCTIAFDEVENQTELFDGFYETSDEVLPEAITENTSMAAKAQDEKERRLLDCIAALHDTMKKASTVDFTKLLNASILEEEKRKAEALALQIAEAERLMAGKKRTIQTAMSFLGISEVDTTKETFAAEVVISCRWREPALDSWSEAKLKEIDYEAFFNPNMYVDNIVVERRTTITNNVFRNDRGETFMVEKTSLRGVFGFNGSLKAFPFDVQELGVTLTTDLSTDQVEIIPSEEELSTLKLKLHIDQLRQTWHLHGHVDMQMKTIRSEMTGAASDRPALEIMARIARNTKFYWYNMYAIIMFLIQFASLTFVIDPATNLAAGTALSARLHLCFMVFLNIISFKIAVSLTMPKLSYMTCVDKYIMYNILTLVAVTFYYGAQSRVIGADVSAEALRSLDRYTMFGTIGTFIVWNFAYFMWLRFSVCKKRYVADDQDSEWKKWMNKKLAWATFQKRQRA